MSKNGVALDQKQGFNFTLNNINNFHTVMNETTLPDHGLDPKMPPKTPITWLMLLYLPTAKAKGAVVPYRKLIGCSDPKDVAFIAESDRPGYSALWLKIPSLSEPAAQINHARANTLPRLPALEDLCRLIVAERLPVDCPAPTYLYVNNRLTDAMLLIDPVTAQPKVLAPKANVKPRALTLVTRLGQYTADNRPAHNLALYINLNTLDNPDRTSLTKTVPDTRVWYVSIDKLVWAGMMRRYSALGIELVRMSRRSVINRFCSTGKGLAFGNWQRVVVDQPDHDPAVEADRYPATGRPQPGTLPDPAPLIIEQRSKRSKTKPTAPPPTGNEHPFAPAAADGPPTLSPQDHGSLDSIL